MGYQPDFVHSKISTSFTFQHPSSIQFRAFRGLRGVEEQMLSSGEGIPNVRRQGFGGQICYLQTSGTRSAAGCERWIKLEGYPIYRDVCHDYCCYYCCHFYGCGCCCCGGRRHYYLSFITDWEWSIWSTAPKALLAICCSIWPWM